MAAENREGGAEKLSERYFLHLSKDKVISAFAVSQCH